MKWRQKSAIPVNKRKTKCGPRERDRGKGGGEEGDKTEMGELGCGGVRRRRRGK